MATVDVATGIHSGLHMANSATKVPYLLYTDLDFAAAATAKGSGLAASDVLQALDVPTYTVIIAAGVIYKTAATGTISAATIDVGIGGGNDFAAGYDIVAGGVGSASTATAADAAPVVIGGTADTVDITLATLTGTLTGGVVRVWAVVCDVMEPNNPGIAQLGS